MVDFRMPDRTAGSDRPRYSRVAADGVLVGLAVPLVAVAVADGLNPQWSWLEHMASYFVHGRAGWLITVTGVSLAAASAVLIRLAVASSRGGRGGLWLLGVWAAGMLVAGVFPADPPGQWDRPPSTVGSIHGVGGLAAFLALPVAAVLLNRAWQRDARWLPVARALRLTTAAVVAAFVVFVVTWIDVMVGPTLSVGSTPTVVGLTERVMLWADVGWLAVAAMGLRRMARDG